MGRKVKRRTKKEIHKISLVTILLMLLVFSLGYVIIKTNNLFTGTNELTASYISFNNLSSTDMIRINNITRKTEKKAKSLLNPSSISFDVKGQKNKEYEIVLYPIETSSNEGVKFYLENNKKIVINDLESVPTRTDGGKIIYKGKISNNNKFILRMWINQDNKSQIDNISYEVKVK